MREPIYSDGSWWHQGDDGSWLKWDALAQRWVEPPRRDSAAKIQTDDVPQLALWWQRLVAFLLDAVALVIPLAVLFWVAVGSGDTQCDAVDGTCGTEDGAAALAFFMVCYFAVAPAYFVLSNGSRRGQTLGKRTMHIKVCDKDTGESIGYGRAFGRWLIFGLFWFFGLVGVLNSLWPLWDPMKQAWHDKAVNSAVVSAPR